MKKRLYNIIFEHDTKAGRAFDIALLWVILFSVVIVIIESIPEVHEAFFKEFYTIEWILTILFSVEYILRIWTSPKPFRYIFSFWGLVDLLSIIPTYFDLFFAGYHYLLTVRIFRLLRVFRILKLVRFNREAQMLFNALKASSYKISVFLMTVLTMVTILGTLMYVIEGSENNFTSIPQSIYWAIVTVTTVGFGDIVPQTVLGKFLSSLAMIMGYAIIAVPTGIITVELSKNKSKVCGNCSTENPISANFCSQCGKEITQLPDAS
ncbi:cyclic nucleotide-gated potassium channel [Pedobacter glucosidilyticus]|nr:ion transporter [Pedobacter glucosidilyticus]KHJ36905.1 cyclic nucleotide-gated potassium channel [Pedobacter glucosidilyticus]